MSAVREEPAPQEEPRHEARLLVNGEETPYLPTLAELLATRNIRSPRGTAVAVNGAVIPAIRWPETRLAPGDRIEIVRPFGGG